MTETNSNSISDQPGLPDSANSHSEIVFSGKVWNVMSKTFELNGDSLTREFIQHPGAVAVLALNESDEVLLINQFRAPVNEFLYEIPAGLRDPEDNSSLETAKRELAEETDYQANTWEPLQTFYTTPGSSSEVIEIFIARGIRKTGSEFNRTGEEKGMVPIWLPFKEVLHSVLESKLKSPTLVLAILSLAARRSS